MNQNQRYEARVGFTGVFMPYGMNRVEYAAKPHLPGLGSKIAENMEN